MKINRIFYEIQLPMLVLQYYRKSCTHIILLLLFYSEKQKLEDSTSSLAEKAEISLSAVENLKGMVKKKEKDLKITQR